MATEAKPDIVAQLKDPQNVRLLSDIVVNLVMLQLKAQPSTQEQVDALRTQGLSDEQELNKLSEIKTPNEQEAVRKKELDDKIAKNVQLQDICFLKDLTVKGYGALLKELKTKFPGLDASDRRNLEKQLQEQATRKILAIEELEVKTKECYELLTKLLVLKMKAQPQTTEKISNLSSQFTTVENDYDKLLQTIEQSLTPSHNLLQRKKEAEALISKLIKQQDALLLKDRTVSSSYGPILSQLEKTHPEVHGIRRRKMEKEVHAHAVRQLEIEKLAD